MFLAWLAASLAVLVMLVAAGVMISILASGSFRNMGPDGSGPPAGDWLLGAQSEVFSHWVNLAQTSGAALLLACGLLIELLLARAKRRVILFLRGGAGVAVLVLVLGTVPLEAMYGEFGLPICFCLFSVPLLGSSYALLRLTVSRVNGTTGVLCVLLFAFLHPVLQWFYEPSHNGAPGTFILLIMLAVLAALILMVQSDLHRRKLEHLRRDQA